MKILVYGWYHQLNIGDDLFMDSFRVLFPDYELIFQNTVKIENLIDIDVIFFGGGSFLLDHPSITDDALQAIKNLPIFYIGIGVEGTIHPTHMMLMSLAKLVVTRSASQIEKLKILNTNVMWIPDLVYSLQSKIKLSKKITRSVLVLPNIAVVPSNSDVHWKHASWAHFKSEFSQFLDILREDGHTVNFLSMCHSNKENDDWAAGEIISHMTHRGKLQIENLPIGIEEVTELISKYSIIITERFHGIVLSEMTKTPYMAISHHDKIKSATPLNGIALSYYNSSKQTFLDAFNATHKLNFDHSLPIESDIFKTFSQKVIELVENGSLCRNQTK